MGSTTARRRGAFLGPISLARLQPLKCPSQVPDPPAGGQGPPASTHVRPHPPIHTPAPAVACCTGPTARHRPPSPASRSSALIRDCTRAARLALYRNLSMKACTRVGQRGNVQCMSYFTHSLIAQAGWPCSEHWQHMHASQPLATAGLPQGTIAQHRPAQFVPSCPKHVSPWLSGPRRRYTA